MKESVTAPSQLNNESIELLSEEVNADSHIEEISVTASHKEEKMESNNPFVSKVAIFNGTNFEDWNVRLMFALKKESLEEYIETDEIEQKYREGDDVERKKPEYKEFRKCNNSAMCFMVERLSPRVLLRVKNCVTAYEMYTNLKTLYKVASDVGKDALRKEFYSLRFNEGGNMKGYIEKFENIAEKYRSVGGTLTCQEELEQFRTSLPASYNHIRNWFSLLQEKDKTYENLKQRVMEDADYIHRDSGKRVNSENRAFYSTYNRFSKPPYRKYGRNNDVKCFECQGVGHIAKNCANRQQQRNSSWNQGDSKEKYKNEGQQRSSASDGDKKRNDDRGDIFNRGSKNKFSNSSQGQGHGARENKANTSGSDVKEKIPFAFIMRCEKEKNIDDNTNKNSLIACNLNECNGDINENVRNSSFVLDSGATDHMVNNSFGLFNVKYDKTGVKCADNHSLTVEYYGDLNIITKNIDDEVNNIVLKDVMYIPNLCCGLISENKITECGLEIKFTKNYANVYVPDNDYSVMLAKKIDRAKIIDCQIVNDVNHNNSYALPVIRSVDYDIYYLWHRRLGHVSAKYLREVPKVVDGVPELNCSLDEFKDCNICIQAKSCRSSHTKERDKGIRILEIVCTDVLGPLDIARNNEQYVVNFIDDMSNFAFVYTICKKSDVFESFDDFFKVVKGQFPDVQIRLLRCDNAREFVMGNLAEFCGNNGIQIEPTNPYTPEQNARAERYNKTLMEKTRAMILDCGIEKTEWPLVVKAAAYLINRMPTRSNNNFKTPFELYYGKRPNIKHIRVFGCVAWQHIERPLRVSKLDPRAVERALVGYTHNGYLLMNPKSKKTYRSCNVNCVESRMYNEIRDSDDTIIGDYIFDGDEFAYEQENISPVILDHNYAMRIISVDESDSLAGCVPTSFNDAICSKFSDLWIKAMKEELESLYENDTWKLVKRSDVKLRPINTKWIYNIKHDESNEMYAKARLVAIGYQDKRNFEIEDVYSPVVSTLTIRWLISLSLKMNLKLVQLDIKTAFLYGTIDYDCFIDIPDGLDIDRKEFAFKLNKALYGLRTSSRIWFDRLENVIRELKFVQFCADRCVFYYATGGILCIIVVYVDDIMMACNNEDFVEHILSTFNENFKMKVIRNPKCFLSVNIVFTDGIVKLHQSDYTMRLLERFGMSGSHGKATPMETNLCIQRTNVKAESTEFRSLIGGLMYLARNTRPDILYATNYLSRFQSEYCDELFVYAKRILRYLKNTMNYGLIYKGEGDRLITSFVDASFATLKDEQYESTTGYAIYSYGNLIEWGTRKQSRTMTSTAAAEYVALNDVTKTILFIRALNKEILSIEEAAVIYEDNTSAVNIAKGTESKESRFLLTKFFAIRQAVEANEIEIVNIEGKFQVADILTKATDVTTFLRLRNFIVNDCSD